MPRVSIVTPTYNHAGYIRECVDSVLAQTFQDWEMLIVDDGSTDDTAEIVRSYHDPRIQLLQKANGGILRLAEGYNLALSHATGEFVAILEGDDYWPPDKLEVQTPEFDDPAVVVVSGFAQIVDDEKNDLGRIPSQRLSEEVRLNRPIGTVTRHMMIPDTLLSTFPVATMIRRSALDRIGGFLQPEGMPTVDYPTLLALGLEGEFRFIERGCGFWRRHIHSTTTSRFPDILDGCYREAMRIAHAQRDRIGLSEATLDWHAAVWEQFQAKRCSLLGRWLCQEKCHKDARRAFTLALKYRTSRRNALINRMAVQLTFFSLPTEWLYRYAHRNKPEADLKRSISPAGDAIVRLSDVDHPWPVYRHHQV